MKHTRLLLSLLAIPALLLVGCSDDDGDSSSASGDSVSSEEAGSDDGGSAGGFADQVNQLCIESTTAMGEIFGPMASADGPPSEEMLQGTYDALVEQLEGEQAELAGMTPPAEMQDDWDALVGAHADAVASVQEQGLAYFEDQETNTFAEVEQMAADMGFDACAGEEG